MVISFHITSAFLLLFSLMGFAQESGLFGTFPINSNNASVEFSARHFGVLNVEGHFKEFTGEITLNNSIIKSGNLSVKVASIYTGNRSRDNSLKNDDFLGADAFPVIQMSIESNSSKDELLILLEIRNVSRTIPASYKCVRLKEQTYRLEVECTISRKDFKLDFGTMNDLISDEIKIKGLLTL